MNPEVKHIIDEFLNDYFINESIKIYNKTLCPLLWDSNKNLNLNIRSRLLEIADDFYKKTKFVAPIKDIWLMGSISNYNWTPKSDIDVHIIINFPSMQMPPETAEKMARVTASNWNAEHNITIKGFKVELNIQSVKAKKPYVTGVYSLLSNQWIRNPSHLDLRLDMSFINSEYEKIDKYLDLALKTNNEEFLKSVKDYLDEYRQYGLDTKGELSVENIVYKLLRNKGKIQKLKDSIISVYDKELSIDEELPLSGEEKYCKQEPGGTMMAVNIDEFDNPHRHSTDNISNGNKNYCWIWDTDTQSVIAKKGGTHLSNFGSDDISNIFRGWYNIDKNIISVVFPKYEIKNLGGKKPKETDIPSIVYKALIRQFGERVKGFLVLEVTQKNINASHPTLHKSVANDMSLMTLGNLKALRDKCGRAMEYLGPLSDDNANNKLWYDQAINDFNKFNNEIKNRLKYINAPVMNEGVGAGNPNTDRLHIPGERWRIKWNDAPATPKMPNAIKENKLDIIKNKINSLTDDDIAIIVQKSEELPESNYVQVDDVSNGINHFSSNPEQMIKLGYNMPNSIDLLKLPQGTYKLSVAKEKLGLNEGFDSNVKNMTNQLIDEFIKKIK